MGYLAISITNVTTVIVALFLERVIIRFFRFSKNGVFEKNMTLFKVHKCSKFDKSFTTIVDLAYHQNSSHAKVAVKHQCPSCIKSFANSTKLRIHIETVHEKKKVKCPLCDSIVLKHCLNCQNLKYQKFSVLRNIFYD